MGLFNRAYLTPKKRRKLARRQRNKTRRAVANTPPIRLPRKFG